MENRHVAIRRKTRLIAALARERSPLIRGGLRFRTDVFYVQIAVKHTPALRLGLRGRVVLGITEQPLLPPPGKSLRAPAKSWKACCY